VRAAILRVLEPCGRCKGYAQGVSSTGAGSDPKSSRALQALMGIH